MNKLSWGITSVAVIAMFIMYWLQNETLEQGDHIFRPATPIVERTEIISDRRERIPISETVPLEPGKMIQIDEYPLGQINIQRLTDRTYWILHNVHGMTMYVGDEEVLLIDAADGLFADRLLERVAKITDKPVTTIVYTHPHLDHIIGANNLSKALAKQGRSLRVIATDQFVEISNLYKQDIPKPTEVVATPVGYFEFDNKRFKIGTPMSVAHSSADSYILTPDGVITFIDFVQPDRLPILDISGVQNMTGFITFLRHVAGEDWIHANTGHMNISSRQDVMFMLEYSKDLYDAWFEIIPDHWGIPAYVKGKLKDENIAIWLRNLFDTVAYKVAAKLEPKYGHYSQFELALDHALKVHWDGFLHYDFMNRPDIRPEFTPIKPTE